MITRATLAPEDFEAALRAILAEAARDPAVAIVRSENEQWLYFAGDPRVVERQVGMGEGGFRATALMQIVFDERVIILDFSGFAGSTAHLGRVFQRLVPRLGRCHLWDEDTGTDLWPTAVDVTVDLFRVDDEFEVHGARS